MKASLSVLMITKNVQETIEKSLQSVSDWVDEIVIVDDYSTDKTIEKVKSLKLKVFRNREADLGKQREFGLRKCNNDWVLVLDADEVVTEELKREIVSLFHGFIAKYDGYLIPFQNYFLGRPINYGGENYKMLRLVKQKAATSKPSLVHEHLSVIGKTAILKNKIYHYSYRSLCQMYKKFTDYAVRDARQRVNKREKTSFKKIFLYPLHMFWARFIKDKGYKDGLFRLPLDLGFAYMEFLTYFLLIFMKARRQNL